MKKNANENFVIVNIPTFTPLLVTPQDLVLFYDDPSKIAEQLTLIDMENYSRIEARQIISKKWNKPKQPLPDDLCYLVQRTNDLSNWVATLILLREKVQDRVLIIHALISIANSLMELGNFTSLMGISMGFEVASISRLKITFGSLQKKTMASLEHLKSIQNPSSKFKNLRNTVAEKPLNIPYVGTTLSDYVLGDEVLNDVVEEEGSGKLINMEKFRYLESCISTYLDNQRFWRKSEKFKFVKDDNLFTLLSSLPLLDEKQLFEISLLREPRESKSPR